MLAIGYGTRLVSAREEINPIWIHLVVILSHRVIHISQRSSDDGESDEEISNITDVTAAKFTGLDIGYPGPSCNENMGM